MLRYLALWLLLRVFAPLPYRVLYGLAATGGTTLWYVVPSVRRVTRDHMLHVMGPEAPSRARDRAARGCTRAAFYYFVDLAKYARMEPDDVFDHVDEITGVPETFAAIDRGCGMILVSAHLGNPEFIVQGLAEVLDLAVVTEPLEPQRLHDLIHGVRGQAGVTFIPADLGGVRQSLGHLRDGGTLAVVSDRDVLGGASLRPFFGEPAPVPSGAVDLARRTGATIIAGVVARTGPGRFRIDLEELPLPEATGDRAADVDSGMEALIAYLERIIRLYPSQWFALSPIWRDEEPA